MSLVSKMVATARHYLSLFTHCLRRLPPGFDCHAPGFKSMEATSCVIDASTESPGRVPSHETGDERITVPAMLITATFEHGRCRTANPDWHVHCIVPNCDS